MPGHHQKDQMMTARDKFNPLFDKYIRAKLIEDRTTITFPEPLVFAKPLTLILLKLIDDNPHFQVLTPKDFDGFDVPSEYGRLIGYKRDHGQIGYFFVEDKPILLDYKDVSFWKNGGTGRLVAVAGGDAVDGAIKFQFAPGNYAGCPFSVYPFIYPGPNDYADVGHFPKYHDSKYNEQFKECCCRNEFHASIFARWASQSARHLFTKVCESIDGSDVLLGKRNFLPINEYMDRMSRSKFAIAARGNGKLSHREFEACSIGVPLLRQNTGELLWRPFLAGVHYIDITPENLIDTFDYYNNHYDEALEIAANGYAYYLDTHPHRSVQNIFKEIVDVILGHQEWTQA